WWGRDRRVAGRRRPPRSARRNGTRRRRATSDRRLLRSGAPGRPLSNRPRLALRQRVLRVSGDRRCIDDVRRDPRSAILPTASAAAHAVAEPSRAHPRRPRSAGRGIHPLEEESAVVLGIHHVGIVVKRLRDAYTFYRGTLGLPLLREADIADQGVRA